MNQRKRRARRSVKLTLNVAARDKKSITFGTLVKNSRQSIRFTLNTSKNLVRNEELQGRKYIAVPMVMLTEGVHRGSNGKLLYLAEDLGKTPAVWNMKPVVVYHPTRNGQGVSATEPEVAEKYRIGMIMNTDFDELGRLTAEAWIEEDLANKVDDRIMPAIENEDMMELSTGVFVDQEGPPGDFEGMPYDAIARNYRPDHLAVLPDQIGACSIEKGAGFIRNQVEDNGAEILDAIVTYNADKPAKSKDEAEGDPAEVASQTAIRKGAWAVISGKQKTHADAAAAHEKAARLYKKAGNKAFHAWHTQKAADHKSWGDEADGDDKPAKNSYDKFNGGTDANANDDEGADDSAHVLDPDSATAQATERTNSAMTEGTALAHRGAAISHRVAASSHRKANEGEDDYTSKYHMSAARLHDSMAKNADADMSQDDVRIALSEKLRGDAEYCPCWIRDVYDSYFVYDDGKGTLCKQTYSIDDDGAVEFDGEPEEVKMVKSYEPTDNTLEDRSSVTITKNMNKKQRIDDLIKNLGWEESDRKYLLGLNDKRVEGIHNDALLAKNTRTAKKHQPSKGDAEDSDAEDNQDDNRPAGNAKKDKKDKMPEDKDDDPATNGKGKKVTVNEYLEGAPAEVQSIVRNALAAEKRERKTLIEAITANEDSGFETEELEKMELSVLQRLAKLATNRGGEEQSQERVPLYGGQGEVAHVTNRSTEGAETRVLGMPTMNFGKDADKEDEEQAE